MPSTAPIARDGRGPLSTAALFLVFNRPEQTAAAFQAVRSARPPRLYVAADGPRPAKAGEVLACEEVRRIATQVDWPCTVSTLFRDRNLGCKRAVSEAITWFFAHEERGIVLEDDCVPHPDFFPFCEALLDRYADDERVLAITGNNFQQGRRRGEASYYFSRYFHCWGWASWRRAWQLYQRDMPFWEQWRGSPAWLDALPDPLERSYWTEVLDRVYQQEIDTWDYQWTASIWFNGGLVATPNANLVDNIGFGGGGTHTKRRAYGGAPKAVGLGPITHPLAVERDAAADHFTFVAHHGGRRWTRKLPRPLRQALRRLLAAIR